MNIGFAMTGSYCTFSQVFPIMEEAAKNHTLIPIFSANVYHTDTRFGTAQSHIRRAAEICGRDPIFTIAQAEPIGPKKMLDALIIAPCTGNTLAKLAHSIADTPVTMAAKSHLRNGRPVIVAVSTNDALAGAAENIGRLLSRKHYYFVPFGQDDPNGKPTSMVADFTKILPTLTAALDDKQIQPILLEGPAYAPSLPLGEGGRPNGRSDEGLSIAAGDQAFSLRRRWLPSGSRMRCKTGRETRHLRSFL